MTRLSRRVGLQVVLGGLVLCPFQAARVAAAEAEKLPARMKLSLAAYSFRDALAGDSPKMTMDDFVRYCAAQGCDACELTSYYFPKGFGRDYLIHLKQLTHRLGLDISGTAIANDFCLADGPKRDESLAHVRTWVDYAATMGAPAIRIFAGSIPAGDTEEAAIARCVEGIEQSLVHAAKQGVILALENHGGITATAESMLKIVRGVKPSPWFGVNFDGGNFYSADPYEEFAQIAPYAVNVQLKVDLTVAGQKERADLAKVIRLLSDAGYRGYVALEYEGAEDPFAAVPRHLGEIRRLIA